MNVKTFFSNQWVVAIFMAVVGLYLSTLVRPSRDLVANLNPSSTAIVKAGLPSKFTLAYDGTPVVGDVTAAQVELWNAGNSPIKAENILAPISVVFDGAVILEATIRRTARDVSHFAVDSTSASKGKLGLSWSILEHFDGAVLQVIYAGKPDLLPRIEGTIEGQRKLRLERWALSSKWNFAAYLGCAAGVVSFLIGLREYRKGNQHWVNVGLMVGGAVCIIWILLLPDAAPPFVYRG